MTTKKGTIEAANDRCSVSDERHGVTYRCGKKAGHERNPEDWEHVASPPEYAPRRAPDWRALFEETIPILESMVDHPALGPQCELARRLIIRYHMTLSNAGLPPRGNDRIT